jgi:hypothetical protein
MGGLLGILRLSIPVSFKSKTRWQALLLAAVAAISTNLFAQRDSTLTRDALGSLTTLQIPHLTREPKLEDFADMQLSPAVAGTMLKVD